MTRTVIRIEELVNQNDDTQVLLRPEEPQDVKDFGRPHELGCRADLSPFTDLAAVAPGNKAAIPNALVRTVGESVYQGLSAHGGVMEALERASRAKVGTVHPIFVASNAMDAEALPFEVLYHPTAEFLGLDPRWPIARMVGQGKGIIARFVKLPVRIAVVLAAADRDAIPEWEALRAAIIGSNLQVDVTLFAAKDDLEHHVAVQAEPWVRVRRVPLSVEDLVGELTRLRPQLLHVFSHGSAKYQGFLEIATRNSVNLGDAPLYVTARDLARLRDLVWLVTLDACEGAMPAGEVHSLAYSLVEDGVQAAIGMREVIDSADASHFCHAFYQKALSGLTAGLVPGSRVAPDWSEPLRAARAALCARALGPTSIVASSYKPWTLPVLCRRSEDFIVQVGYPGLAISEADQERVFADIDTMQQLRDGLPPDTPAATKAILEAAIAEVRKRLV